MQQKTYAFVDGSNIIYSARAEGWHVDQKKLFDYLKRKFNVSKAFFYYGKDDENKKQEKFLKKLENFGYSLRVKQIKKYSGRIKANCDVDLTMDMLILMNKYIQAIVLSGDGDFLPLYQYLQKENKDVVIIGSAKNTAREVRKFAGEKFIGLANLRGLLESKS
jgi:uncharacterized LabA/DUF88 family protein